MRATARATARATHAPIPEEEKRRLRAEGSPNLQPRSVARLGPLLPQPTCAAPGADVYAAELRGRRGETQRGRYTSPANGWTAPAAARARGWCVLERAVPKPCSQCWASPEGARGAPHSRVHLPPR